MKSPVLAAVILGLLLGFAYPSLAAEGEGWLKRKIKERIREKLENQPAPAVTASADEPITKPGDYTFGIKHGGIARYYMVHVPPSYDGKKAVPLLFSIHGGGGDMGYMARDEFYGQVSEADKRGYVVVFPNGYSNFASGKIATWNAGACCGNARDKNIDDVGFFRAMVANITRQLNIDTARIYATGMSNGGMMSERLACEMADVFAAIASVAGPDGTKECKPARPISVLQIHAQDDDHVLFNGGAGQNAFQDLSTVTDFTSIPDTVAHWVKRNNCAARPQRVLENDGVYCDLYTGCDAGAQVKLCVTATGGHSWPGGSKPGGIKRKSATSKAISANEEMWTFFDGVR